MFAVQSPHYYPADQMHLTSAQPFVLGKAATVRVAGRGFQNNNV